MPRSNQSNTALYPLFYTLQLADNALIHGHRQSEWCGHGPVLEQDIAITNLALDHIGQARNLYQYASEQFRKLLPENKLQAFLSTPLQQALQNGTDPDEDDLAYLRDGWDFRNVLLTEQPDNDWGYAVAKSFFYDTYQFFLYQRLRDSKDSQLSAIAEKSLKEVRYHIRWSSEWLIRLGDGTEESHNRMQQAVNDLWSYTGEMTTPNEVDLFLTENGIGADLKNIQQEWQEKVSRVLVEATLSMPSEQWMQQGGKQGIHSEHMGFMLAEMQFMQRAYPGMKW